MKNQFFVNEINGHFNLREPKSNVPTMVFFVVRINGKQIKLSTGLKVYPSHWNKIDQLAFISPKLDPLDNANNELLNKRMLLFRNRFNNFKMYISQHSEEVDNCEHILRQFVLNGRQKKSGKNVSIVDKMERAVMRNNNIKPSTKESYMHELSRSSKTSFPAFLRAIKKPHLTFNDINKVLLKQFETFLFNCNKRNGELISTNAVENKITKFLAILNHCASLGYFDNAQISGYKKPKQEESESGIFLTQEEVDRIYNLRLTGKLDLARDILVFLCQTGQRFSDLMAMRENGILKKTEFGESIRYISTKENNEVFAPLLGAAKEIYKKYQGVPVGEFTAIVTDVKEVARRARIDREVLKKEIRGGQVIIKKKKAYELIGTHTGRRTFINNMLLNKNPTYLIMKVTGHKTEYAFKRYVGISSEEASQIFLKNDSQEKGEEAKKDTPKQKEPKKESFHPKK